MKKKNNVTYTQTIHTNQEKPINICVWIERNSLNIDTNVVAGVIDKLSAISYEEQKTRAGTKSVGNGIDAHWNEGCLRELSKECWECVWQDR